MNSRIYDIVYIKLRTWLTPDVLHKPKLLSLLHSLTHSVEQLYVRFKAFRNEKVYQLSITPQVFSLEKLLNDRYDRISRRITIVDSLDQSPTYIFIRSESKPFFLKTRGEEPVSHIYTRSETGIIPNDFVILVPLGIQFEENEMIALVKRFCLAGKKIKIQVI